MFCICKGVRAYQYCRFIWQEGGAQFVLRHLIGAERIGVIEAIWFVDPIGNRIGLAKLDSVRFSMAAHCVRGEIYCQDEEANVGIQPEDFFGVVRRNGRSCPRMVDKHFGDGTCGCKVRVPHGTVSLWQ